MKTSLLHFCQKKSILSSGKKFRIYLFGYGKNAVVFFALLCSANDLAVSESRPQEVGTEIVLQ